MIKFNNYETNNTTHVQFSQFYYILIYVELDYEMTLIAIYCERKIFYTVIQRYFNTIILIK